MLGKKKLKRDGKQKNKAGRAFGKFSLAADGSTMLFYIKWVRDCCKEHVIYWRNQKLQDNIHVQVTAYYTCRHELIVTCESWQIYNYENFLK